jgi:Transposase DDE domain
MKVSVAVDRTGVPVGVLTAAANVADAHQAGDTLGAIPDGVEPVAGTPVIADKGYDSDPLRAELAADGCRLIAPHRKNRTRPATTDGRRLRRCRQRGNPDMIDVAVVGAGPANAPAALRIAQLGDRTVLVSRGEFGGLAANGPRPRSSRLGLLFPRTLRAPV